MEEMLISRVLPMMQVRYTKGRQLCYKDHIINFPQNIATIATRLPRLPEDTDTVIIRRDTVDLTRHVDFVVRREKVREALQYKINHDPHYRDLQVDEEALSQLPENGTVVDRIPTCRAGQQADAPEAAGPAQAAALETLPDNGNESDQQINGVINLGDNGNLEIQQVRVEATRIINQGPVTYEQNNVILSAPHVDSTPIDERTPGYIVMAFPTLFPDGSGDFHQARLRKVHLSDYFAHLLRFHDSRFGRHKRFPWFAFNTLQRHRTRDQARIFVRQQHDAARLTVAEIQTMLDDFGDEALANRMIRYGAQLRGTRAYWLARRSELIDMIRILQSPHVFFTLSAADLQWPDLHRHMPREIPESDEDESARKRQRRLALNNNPHLAASYLDHRVQLYLKHFLGPLLGVKHFWYRYEWQDRGSGHVHGFFWLKDAPNPNEIDWDLLKKPNPNDISPDQLRA